MRKVQGHKFGPQDRGLVIDYDKDPVSKRNKQYERQKRQREVRWGTRVGARCAFHRRLLTASPTRASARRPLHHTPPPTPPDVARVHVLLLHVLRQEVFQPQGCTRSGDHEQEEDGRRHCGARVLHRRPVRTARRPEEDQARQGRRAAVPAQVRQVRRPDRVPVRSVAQWVACACVGGSCLAYSNVCDHLPCGGAGLCR